MNNFISPNSFETNNFLHKLFEVVSDSNANPEVVYPFLEANLNKLDDTLPQVLLNWATATLPQLDLIGREKIANTINALSNLMRLFPQGDRSRRLEIALAGYKIVLGVYTFVNNPEIWAATEHNRGQIYLYRVQGKRIDNLEEAIRCFQYALSVYTKENFSEQWARIKTDLGLAYRDRIQGIPSENLQEAIQYFKSTLQIYTYENHPIQWAVVQNHLGLTYLNYTSGNQTENLQQAIECFRSALQVYTLERFPQQSTKIQANLNQASHQMQELANASQQQPNTDTSALSISESEAGRLEIYQQFIQEREERQKAYEKLIKSLVDFSSDVEKAFDAVVDVFFNIIIVRPDLFDKGLANQMERVADNLAKTGNQNAAKFLGSFASILPAGIDAAWFQAREQIINWIEFLAELGIKDYSRVSSKMIKSLFFAAMRNQSLAANFQEYFAFVNEVLDTTKQSQGETRILYPLLENNLDKLDENFSEVLRSFATAILPTSPEVMADGVKPELAQELAEVIGTFSSLILSFDKGDRASNIEIAITGCEVAANVFTREANFLEQRGATLFILGCAYYERFRGNKEDNLSMAIRYFSAASEAYNPENFPQQWVSTKNNLGVVYRELSIYEPTSKNLLQAIDCLLQALDIHNRQANPSEWAKMKINLGIVYGMRNQEGDLAAAINCFLDSLNIYKRSTFPQEHAITQALLGLAYQADGQLYNAKVAYGSAIETVESLRDEIVKGSGTDADKQKLAEQWNQFYQRMVAVCIQQHDYTQAIEYVERSKARNLVELMATRNLLPKGDIPEYVLHELKQLRQKIATVQRRINIASPDDLTGGISFDGNNQGFVATPSSRITERTQLENLQQKLDELINSQIKPRDPSFSLSQRVETISWKQMRKLLPNDHTAIIEFYVTDETIYTFIITSESSDLLVPEPLGNVKELFDFCFNKYFNAYSQQRDQWRTNLPMYLRQLAGILHIDDIISQIPNTCNQLILIPHRFLHILPLHALPLKNGYSLLDRFTLGVRYAPSCQILQLTQNQERDRFNQLFAIQNPTSDLDYADMEVKIIKQCFQNSTTLVKQKATKTAFYQAAEGKDLRLANCFHFSGHATFDFDDPLKSSLILADTKLALGEVFAMDLSQCRLVILSGCETGVTDFKNVSDEYISLPSGFLYAGSPSVVSSLWKVDDKPTAFLMIKFYQNYLQHQLDVAKSLRDAQIWLRNITSQELKEWSRSLDLTATQKVELEEWFEIINPLDFPFASPYYWASFCAIGQ
ncbi:hypothetical protein PCC9214_05810 [Planktothrix tepida]|uniref:CHAT domain-containing protein n=1 Tax=Planktothrix tepida PCC 9214 TaxID=671072 RepID=A0A1J1LU85_9CYAN|nr:CHAT domain-containing tetratricopeptide repeat protein [Planktothrix tepida]CAD5990493.1 hypothetical protein PCC9214_05810 [Planktothrix tepida]CUR35404.1 hypothetical protein PL9214670030 [Planktothrix tepida PCC 9214]